MKKTPTVVDKPGEKNESYTKMPGTSEKRKLKNLTGPLSSKGIFVSLKSDFGIKKVFKSNEGKSDFERMLTAFGAGFIEPVQEIEFLESEKLGSIKFERKAIFDFVFRDKDDRVYELEMQREFVRCMFDRSFFYTCRYHSAEMQPGTSYHYDHKPLTSVVITDFDLPELKGGPCIDFHAITSQSKGNIVTKATNFLTIELTKFNKSIEELEGEKDVFLFLLANMGDLKEIPACLDNEKYRPLFERARIANFNKEEMKKYNAMNRQEEKRLAELYSAEWKGIEKGREIEKLKLIERLIDRNHLPLEEIAEISNLPLSRIEEIKTKMEHALL